MNRTEANKTGGRPPPSDETIADLQAIGRRLGALEEGLDEAGKEGYRRLALLESKLDTLTRSLGYGPPPTGTCEHAPREIVTKHLSQKGEWCWTHRRWLQLCLDRESDNDFYPSGPLPSESVPTASRRPSPDGMPGPWETADSPSASGESASTPTPTNSPPTCPNSEHDWETKSFTRWTCRKCGREGG